MEATSEMMAEWTPERATATNTKLRKGEKTLNVACRKPSI
ncbi:hypothetical protein THTE_2552 [Thermogutta terrifontis]|uniref:Uncharacterized protein n=1 Tax=Thermogutta terrifontis TaxID=1331910 RepID=A0A286RGQ6_9BACT|nr:hypothetical protein THTE_2552 [Thermogutta terrifontis]